MNSATHTPGPWMIEPINSGETYQITTTHAKEFLVICETPDGLEMDEANARLIAAAPELLQALKALHQLITHETDLAFHVANVYARLVIAKAEGGAI